MKNLSIKYGLIIVILSALVACGSTPNQAPVLERSHEPVSTDAVKIADAPASKPAEPRPSYVVKRGDTLLRIAFDHGQNYKDLVLWNNLSNANDIKVDQVLWVAAPDATGNAKTSPIGVGGGVEIRNLTPINPATNKSSPRGDKRPYSESNLAEMQKDASSANNTTIANKSDAGALKPVEKSAASVTENIEWIWPTEGKLTASFDAQKSKGLDIAGKSGQDIVAVAPGKVIYEGNAMRGYGNILIIKHANNFLSAYAHNKTNLVKEGQSISRGQKIAEMGNTDTDSVKLHFEIRQAGSPVDPLKYLPAR